MADRPDSLITTTGPLPGLQLVQDINAWLEALQNTWRGSDPPPSPASGQQWIDDSAAPWLLKQYDGADWQTIWAIDESSGRPSLIAPPYRGESAPPVTYPYQWWMDTSGANPRLRQRSEENDGWVDVAEHEDGEWRPFISGEAQQVGTQSDHDEAAATLVRGDRLAASAGFPFANMPLVGGAPIVENGSNSDGRWTKYADGTQIVTTVNVSIDRSSDSSFDISNIIELPVAFSNSEYFAVGMRQTSSGRASPRPEYVIANKTTDTVDVRAAREDTTGQSTVSFAAMCVGDWE